MSVFHQRTVVPSVEDYRSTLRKTLVNPLLPTWYLVCAFRLFASPSLSFADDIQAKQMEFFVTTVDTVNMTDENAPMYKPPTRTYRNSASDYRRADEGAGTACCGDERSVEYQVQYSTTNTWSTSQRNDTTTHGTQCRSRQHIPTIGSLLVEL